MWAGALKKACTTASRQGQRVGLGASAANHAARGLPFCRLFLRSSPVIRHEPFFGLVAYLVFSGHLAGQSGLGGGGDVERDDLAYRVGGWFVEDDGEIAVGEGLLLPWVKFGGHQSSGDTILNYPSFSSGDTVLGFMDSRKTIIK